MEKCPEDIALKMVSKDSQDYWFKVWLDSGCSWATVQASETFTEKDERETSKVEAWLTQGMLQDLYTSEAVAAAIVRKKRRRSEPLEATPRGS